MDIRAGFLTDEERVILDLRALYYRFGYTQYRMSKFEEYDLYAQNKDFLMSDRVITFNDTDGRLMALKPDVTLSIVRNRRRTDAPLQKCYYDENVYRVSRTSGVFREIRQLGLECIGQVEPYHVAETVLLAMLSLTRISPDVMLCLSQLDILPEALERAGVPENRRPEALRLIREKNAHELSALCVGCGADAALLNELLTVKATPEEKIAALKAAGCCPDALDQAERLVKLLNDNGMAGRFNIDLSILPDAQYYNGIVFKGYVSGLPDAVISGGQYDRLMRKLGHESGAIGFAVYMDMLERLSGTTAPGDGETVLIYDEGADESALMRAARALAEGGTRVRVERDRGETPAGCRVARLKGSEVVICEDA